MKQSFAHHLIDSYTHTQTHTHTHTHTQIGMIHPLKQMAMRGVIFYQGEEDLYQPNYYECAFPAMIRYIHTHTFLRIYPTPTH